MDNEQNTAKPDPWCFTYFIIISGFEIAKSGHQRSNKGNYN
jgi:hypothetical protein